MSNEKAKQVVLRRLVSNTVIVVLFKNNRKLPRNTFNLYFEVNHKVNCISDKVDTIERQYCKQQM